MGQLDRKELGKRVTGQPGTTSQRCQDPGWAKKGGQGLSGDGRRK